MQTTNPPRAVDEGNRNENRSHEQVLLDIRRWIDFCIENRLTARTAAIRIAGEVLTILAPDGAADSVAVLDPSLELAAMADDPEVRREIDQIQIEFAVTEMDGLSRTDERQTG